VRKTLPQGAFHDLGQRHHEGVQAVGGQDEGSRTRLLVGHVDRKRLAVRGHREGRELLPVDHRHVSSLRYSLTDITKGVKGGGWEVSGGARRASMPSSWPSHRRRHPRMPSGAGWSKAWARRESQQPGRPGIADARRPIRCPDAKHEDAQMRRRRMHYAASPRAVL
jgi:hypothetical protein